MSINNNFSPANPDKVVKDHELDNYQNIRKDKETVVVESKPHTPAVESKLHHSNVESNTPSSVDGESETISLAMLLRIVAPTNIGITIANGKADTSATLTGLCRLMYKLGKSVKACPTVLTNVSESDIQNHQLILYVDQHMSVIVSYINGRKEGNLVLDI